MVNTLSIYSRNSMIDDDCSSTSTRGYRKVKKHLLGSIGKQLSKIEDLDESASEREKTPVINVSLATEKQNIYKPALQLKNKPTGGIHATGSGFGSVTSRKSSQRGQESVAGGSPLPKFKVLSPSPKLQAQSPLPVLKAQSPLPSENILSLEKNIEVIPTGFAASNGKQSPAYSEDFE